jgi:DNA modification methylase
LLEDGLLPKRGRALNDDSRKLSIASNSVDMVFTSPPYLNVQTYARSNWLRLWFLGYNYKEIRKSIAESGSKVRYKEFLEKSLIEVRRVMKRDKWLFIVLGDLKIKSEIKGTTVGLPDFVLPIIKASGFRIVKVLRDDIPSTKRVFTYLGNNKGIKSESIICAKSR